MKWKVGDTVAWYTYRYSNYGSAGESTVVAVGKRDVTLANGDKFNGKTNRSHGANDVWATPTVYTTPDDPAYRRARGAILDKKIGTNVHLKYDAWRRSPTVESAQVLINALTEWIDHNKED